MSVHPLRNADIVLAQCEAELRALSLQRGEVEGRKEMEALARARRSRERGGDCANKKKKPGRGGGGVRGGVEGAAGVVGTSSTAATSVKQEESDEWEGTDHFIIAEKSFQRAAEAIQEGDGVCALQWLDKARSACPAEKTRAVEKINILYGEAEALVAGMKEEEKESFDDNGVERGGKPKS